MHIDCVHCESYNTYTRTITNRRTMSQLTQGQIDELQRAFELTQDSGVVDMYGAKKMLQIFNMNPTGEEVARRYQDHNKDTHAGLTFEQFREVFEDYLVKRDRVPDALTRTLTDLFEGPVSKTELRKILTEMGSEPFESEEADEVINEITFDENGHVSQDGLLKFLLNRVNISTANEKRARQPEQSRDSPVLARENQSDSEDEF